MYNMKKYSLLEREVPFEFHLTTEIHSIQEESKFLHMCEWGGQDMKPIMIELSNGMSQPMISTVLKTDDLTRVVRKMYSLKSLFNDYSFQVNRVKIEVPHIDSELFSQSIEHYFEWHGKVKYIGNEEIIDDICDMYNVHVSNNALKNTPDLRFLTIRDHYHIDIYFKPRIAGVKKELKRNNIELIKEESEYCIYDSNQDMDKKWMHL